MKISIQAKIAIIVTILLWASAYVAIRAALKSYTPEGLALLRYLIASLCMAIVYLRLPPKGNIVFRDKLLLLMLGVIGIGIYNVTLNHGEEMISSGMASFITSQSPIITTIIAIIFFGEKLNLPGTIGFIISLSGVLLIAAGELGGFRWNLNITYILIATLCGSCYSVLQKPFLKKYHAIEATTFVIWGGTLFLSQYFPLLYHDIAKANFIATTNAIYLGIFPAAIGYIAWSYVLSEIPASRAVSFIYFMPFLTTLLGWILLGEVPVLISILGGLLAIFGVWLVNRSFRVKPTMATTESVN